MKRRKRCKGHRMDGITIDIIKLGGGGGGGGVVLNYLTNIFNNVLKTKQISDSWHEAILVILFKKGDPPKTSLAVALYAFCHTATKYSQDYCKLDLIEF